MEVAEAPKTTPDDVNVPPLETVVPEGLFDDTLAVVGAETVPRSADVADSLPDDRRLDDSGAAVEIEFGKAGSVDGAGAGAALELLTCRRNPALSCAWT